MTHEEMIAALSLTFDLVRVRSFRELDRGDELVAHRSHSDHIDRVRVIAVYRERVYCMVIKGRFTGLKYYITPSALALGLYRINY